jgi:uncharacterized protein (DUF2252 family)
MIPPSRSLRERVEFGRHQRHVLKRSDQSNWDAKRRKRDPLDIIREINAERIAELVPIKMARMALSPFAFFRGSVPVMAADLAAMPSTKILAQICGDAHVRNLGAYAAPDGRLVFDLNDFDETIFAPWEWDLKRLAASLVLAGREASNSDRQCREAVLVCAETYRRKMQEFSQMTCLDVAKYRIHRQFAGTACASVLERAERATPAHSLVKLTVRHGKSRVFKEQKPVLTHPAKATVRGVLRGIEKYRETLSPSSLHLLNFYRPVDVAFKIVGTGSVATHDYVVLHFAGDGTADPMFLQVKEAVPSAYAPYVKSPETGMHQGQRVVHGQRLMQFQSDILLGWTTVDNREYLVRQLSDHKGSISDEDLQGAGLVDYSTTCGEVLARGHARSGDPAVIGGYLGTNDRWDTALAKFAAEYADQTTEDYEAFKAAVRNGTMEASRPYLL